MFTVDSEALFKKFSIMLTIIDSILSHFVTVPPFINIARFVTLLFGGFKRKKEKKVRWRFNIQASCSSTAILPGLSLDASRELDMSSENREGPRGRLLVAGSCIC